MDGTSVTEERAQAGIRRRTEAERQCEIQGQSRRRRLAMKRRSDQSYRVVGLRVPVLPGFPG